MVLITRYSHSASLVSGAAVWKDRPGHFLIFILFWTTFVYNPIARWTWNPAGWPSTKRVLDFAGGTPVHICAGATVLAHSLYHLYLPELESFLGKVLHPDRGTSSIGTSRSATVDWRTGFTVACQSHETGRDGSHNIRNVLTGTLFLWIGWFGFNGGSALGANLRAVSACISTHLSACAGGVTLCIWRSFSEYFEERRNEDTDTPQAFSFSVAEFCNGVIIGLVCITPGAGYVRHQVSPLFGIIGVIVCANFTPFSDKLKDTYFIVVVHGLGGIVGMFLTGCFATNEVAHLDGFTNIDGGAWDGKGKQIG